MDSFLAGGSALDSFLVEDSGLASFLAEDSGLASFLAEDSGLASFFSSCLTAGTSAVDLNFSGSIFADDPCLGASLDADLVLTVLRDACPPPEDDDFDFFFSPAPDSSSALRFLDDASLRLASSLQGSAVGDGKQMSSSSESFPSSLGGMN